MQHSLARYRHLKPTPPFTLGGIFVRSGDRNFLKDAIGMVEIQGGEFAGLNDGDLVSVRIEAEGMKAGRVEIVSLTASQRENKPRPHAAAFAAFVDEVRAYLKNRGLSEVFTPSLVVCPGLEPSLEPFAVADKFLPTSPEIHLKKALADGHTDIFEIKSCFRDKENSPHHAAEFLMLEWYRSFADLEMVIEDLHGLVGRPITITTFANLFREILEFELRPETTAKEMEGLCHQWQVETHPTDTFGDLFHRLVIEFIEPALLKSGQPTIVRDFPPSQAALAKIKADGWADRFELYWNGLEVANAFNEVTSASEQAARWAGETAERKRLGTKSLPIDSEMLQALEKGLPPTGGIALGLERLYMAKHGLSDIKELRLF
jgi:lysyl-tRNA synthetase class 2